MNDLNGLDWSSKPATGQKPGQGNYSAFSTLKPTPPTSGRASPLVSKPQSPPLKVPTPANDSFGNLVAFGGNGTNKNLSLQEQQKRLAESKLQQLVGQKQKLQDQWAGNDDVWNSLGSGRSTPAVQNRNGTPAPTQQAAEEEDDLFAAFNKPTLSQTKSPPVPAQAQQPEPDDDPFGLSEFQARNNARSPPAQIGTSLPADDDDILGDLGKPISERPPPRKEPARRRPSPDPAPAPTSDHPQDKAVAELVDMGFPADKAKRALEATDTGMNVQAAVGLLLNQAHEEARQKSRGREPTQSQDGSDEPPTARRPRPRQSGVEHERGQNGTRDGSSTPSNDPTKAVQEFGTTFIKSAGAFWKTAQKQVQQAVSEFNSDSETASNQPKWMQPAAPEKTRNAEQDPRRARPSSSRQQQQPSATDEAMMLETERPTPPPRQAPRSRAEHVFDSSADASRDHSPAMPSRLRESTSPQPAFMRQQQQDPMASMMRPKPQQPPTRAMLNKQAAEDQASQAYVSSARRRKPTTPAPTQEDDLLEGTSTSKPLPSRPTPKSAPPPTQSRPPKPAPPLQTRPPPPTRTIPPIPPLSLKASHSARLTGNDHFKRGDYSSAHDAYSTSLRHIPASHPLSLILLTNRSLTALKTGQPKIAILDADAAITLIGPSKGEAETVDMADGDGTPAKPMREYYGKALMRKAEALENLEKWGEAAVVWRQAVEDGHGGATAIQGRARAERAAAPKGPTVKKAAPPRPTRSAPPVSAKPAAAVNALRAQNQAAEKLDDERFALIDSVTARVNNWKGGKEGNIRALLASLDSVLWEGAGWKKIGMADLVLPNKVKINYMKGIGRCHPDKIPTDATTEQRMIAGAVFSTLNEAWDKFRTENGM
ncbi:auxilin-like clathrin-binding protein required for normal clathrin function [Knufia obscura]|uniref:Auxilin-like clathrin-binding protein required for normal clathrin function n=1 Tax=Knufia obscura TaxID=1635080 RepID=A0ABR0RK15_9EURO|nr:auxilin-like clathrin-binding protein required for normal clathrin function [Knufia obscura]